MRGTATSILLLVIAATILSVARPCPAHSLFDARRNYRTGRRPKSVVVGDLDSDGCPDLAAANSGNRFVSVMIGLGDGTFEPAYDVPTQGYPLHITGVDLNLDGHLDLVTADAVNNISVLIGHGNGTFSVTGYEVNDNPYCVAVGDVNGDGALDLAVPHRTGGTTDDSVAVLLGNGDGTFQEPSFLWGFNDAWGAAVGHFDDDPYADLAVTSRLMDRMTVLPGNAKATFGPPTHYSTDSCPMEIVADYLTGDDHLDLIVTHYDINIFFGYGDGTFHPAINYNTPGAEAVAVGDVDGDGDKDLALANGSSYCVSLLLANPPPAGVFYSGGRYATGSGPKGVALNDLDGDGDLDLVSANDTGKCLSVFPGRGDGTFVSAVPYAVGEDPFCVASADLDEDGHMDLVVGCPELHVLPGNGDGTFGAAAGHASGGRSADIVAAYFNDDAHVDVAVANYGDDRVSVLLGDGNGGLDAPIMTASGDWPRSLATGDFDADGQADLVVANAGATYASILLGTGTGSFVSLPPVEVGGWPHAVVVADFNRDSVDDFAAEVDTEYQSYINVFLGKGDGSFQPPLIHPVGWERTLRAMETDDLDGDGICDLVVANYWSGEAMVLLGNGDGTFGSPTSYGVRGSPDALALGDFTADGNVDLCVIGADVSILVGRGDGTFEDAIFFGAERNPYAAVATDFDGDGDVDLAVANAASGNLSVLISRASDWTSVSTSFTAVAESDESVTLRWVVPDNADWTGLNIRRALSTSGQFRVVNPAPLPVTQSGVYVDVGAWPGTTFYYILRAVLGDGSEVDICGAPVAATTGGHLALVLEYPRPNPLVHEATIRFTIPGDGGRLSLAVFDVSGRLVKTLADHPRTRGRHEFTWDGRSDRGVPVSSGIYFVRLSAPGGTRTRKLLVLR
ncbi:VCBS repeat-containing protein [bacterium]|nr:VCBS repeat-containing protein [bacterium]